MTTNMGKDYCPSCNTLLDKATGAFEDAVPVPGDISVCWKCGTILNYASDMALEIMPEAKIAALDRITQMQLAKVQYGIRYLNIKLN